MNDRDKIISEAIMFVLNFHRGYEHRITRKMLLLAVRKQILTMPNRWIVLNTGEVSDRALRCCIEELRTETVEGANICSTTQDHGGYYLATSKQELLQYIRSEQNRIVSISNKLRKQRLRAGVETELQPVLL